MSVVKADMIDGMAADGNTLVLAISDHLIWDREKAAHLSMLQEKLNKYIYFFESGTYRQYFEGQSFGRLRIEIFFLHQWDESFDKLLELASGQLKERKIDIVCTLKDDIIERQV